MKKVNRWVFGVWGFDGIKIIKDVCLGFRRINRGYLIEGVRNQRRCFFVGGALVKCV